MIYDYFGNEIYTPFDSECVVLRNAYDSEGNSVYPELLRVMSYNVQDYKGINSQSGMQQQIIQQTYKPHIVCVQEFYTTDTVPQIAQDMFNGFNLYRSTHKNFLALASKKQLYNITSADFVTQDPSDWSQYSETRAYIKGYLTYQNKEICLINTHLSLNEQYMIAQMEEIFDIATQENYCIIFGDFNIGQLDFGTMYNGMYKPFYDLGWNFANFTPDIGITKTFSTSTSATTLDELSTAPDNIITSPNIEIVDTIYDTTKFSWLNGSAIDHIAVICDLRIN